MKLELPVIIFKAVKRRFYRTLAHIKDRVATWSWTQKVIVVVLIILVILPIVQFFNPCIKVWLNNQSLILVIIALILTLWTIWQNIEVFHSLEVTIGLKHYVIEAANRYENATERVLGVLGHWQVSKSLEYALIHSSCASICFIGEIKLDSMFPGVLWRLNLNDERIKNGLNPIEIFHVSKPPMRFIVIDEDKVLHEKTVGGRFSGSIEDNAPDLANAFAALFETLYPTEQRENAKQRVIQLLKSFLLERIQVNKIEIRKVQDLIVEKILFESGPYAEVLDRKKFCEILEKHINELSHNFNGLFEIDSQEGLSVLIIKKKELK